MLTIQYLNFGQLFGPYMYCNQLINKFIPIYNLKQWAGVVYYMIDVQEMQNAADLHVWNIYWLAIISQYIPA